MTKLRLGVLLGGMSTEHDVSLLSGKNVLQRLDKNKYEIYPIYIDLNGAWYEYKGDYNNIEKEMEDIIKIGNVIEYLKRMDVIFPVLHGEFGEDGSVQGLLKLLKIPYVGCGILASSIGMDKIYSKAIFQKAKIKQASSCYIKSYNDKYIYVYDNFNEEVDTLEYICEKIENKIDYPMFVKPSNSGSSVGVNKARDREELQKYIKEATEFDEKVLIEEAIIGKEVECAVLGNHDVIAGCVGEIRLADDFYSFDAKYKNNSSEIIIPATIEKDKMEEIKNLAIKAFKAIDGKGLARVDFFVENNTGEIYLNEINTMPGFTDISMYPMLMKYFGIEYEDLLDKLIELALDNE